MKDWLETAREADYTARGFKFAVGGELDLRLHYRTLGALAPDRGNAVLMLRGPLAAASSSCSGAWRISCLRQTDRSTRANISSYSRTPLGTAAPASRVTGWKPPSRDTATPTLSKRSIAL
jgi:hypothetical protein